MILPEKKYFQPLEVARYFGVSRSCVYSWITDGKLPAVKVVGALRIKRKDILELEKKGEQEMI